MATPSEKHEIHCAKRYLEYTETPFYRAFRDRENPESFDSNYAVLKRMEGSQNTASYRDAEVNFSKGTISKGDQEMVLTKNEMIIFQLLLANREKIVSRDEIMTDLWDNDEFVNDNALTVNISRLRGKLADLGYDDAIETRKKQGYRLV